MKKTKKEKYTFIDLFAGIGGIRLGYESAGCKCVFSCEWDDKCKITYKANFGDTPVGDIRKVDEKTIPDHDILTGGFPCQPFSIAGISKKRSLGRATGFADETQGTLFFEIVRILKEKRPKAFMLENVKNLLGNDNGRTWAIIQQKLSDLDYQVFWKVLDGQAFVPQHRERLFIVGFDKKRYGDKMDFSFDITPKNPKPILNDILEENVDPKYTLTDHLWNYLQERKIEQKAKGNGFGFSYGNLTGITHTLSARYGKDGSEILVPQEGQNPRRLTPRECARLQGFDDTYKIVVGDATAYHQFGNSVVVPLIGAIAKKVVSKLDELEGK
jgi:DNA (cytosine-5)-methyltransferase 1